jgi:hypothetical protein
MTTAYIAGNSHVICLFGATRRAAAGSGRRLAARTVAPRHFDVDGSGIFFTGITKDLFTPHVFADVRQGVLRFAHEGFRKDLAEWSGTDTVSAASPWGICNVGNSSRAIYRDEVWRSFAPSHLAEGSLTPLTDDVIKSILAKDHQGKRGFYERLIALGLPAFAISGPPPRHDHPAISGDGYAPDLLLHLDGLARQVWRDWLGQRGISIVEPPVEAVGADGFLLPELRNVRTDGVTDLIHANEAYGELMVNRIAEHVASMS